MVRDSAPPLGAEPSRRQETRSVFGGELRRHGSGALREAWDGIGDCQVANLGVASVADADVDA